MIEARPLPATGNHDSRQAVLGAVGPVSAAWQDLLARLREQFTAVREARLHRAALASLRRDCDLLLVGPGGEDLDCGDAPAVSFSSAAGARVLLCEADPLTIAAAAVRYLADLGARHLYCQRCDGMLARGASIAAAARGLDSIDDPDPRVHRPLGVATGPAASPEAVAGDLERRGFTVGIDAYLVVCDDRPIADERHRGWPLFGLHRDDLADAVAAALVWSLDGHRPTRPFRIPIRPDPILVDSRRHADDVRLAAVLTWIHDHAHRELTVDDIAAAAGISRRSLQRLFADRLGRPPWSEVLRVRVERARQLLLQSDAPLATIAHRVGFNEGDRLTAAFRRFVGCTPGQWRRRR